MKGEVRVLLKPCLTPAFCVSSLKSEGRSGCKVALPGPCRGNSDKGSKVRQKLKGPWKGILSALLVGCCLSSPFFCQYRRMKPDRQDFVGSPFPIPGLQRWPLEAGWWCAWLVFCTASGRLTSRLPGREDSGPILCELLTFLCHVKL